MEAQDTLEQTLQTALERGRQEFNKNDLSTHQQFSDYLTQTQFYESNLRNILPNPAYDNAAKTIGKYFPQVAAEHGLSFLDVLPGDFSASKEFEDKGNKVRQFSMRTYRNGQPFTIIKIAFTHLHNKKFGFPAPT